MISRPYSTTTPNRHNTDTALDAPANARQNGASITTHFLRAEHEPVSGRIVSVPIIAAVVSEPISYVRRKNGHGLAARIREALGVLVAADAGPDALHAVILCAPAGDGRQHPTASVTALAYSNFGLRATHVTDSTRPATVLMSSDDAAQIHMQLRRAIATSAMFECDVDLQDGTKGRPSGSRVIYVG